MPTEVVNALTDDQVALFGCFVALLVTGTVMSLSYYLGRGARGETSASARLNADVIPLAGPATARDDSRDDRSDVPRKDAA